MVVGNNFLLSNKSNCVIFSQNTQIASVETSPGSPRVFRTMVRGRHILVNSDFKMSSLKPISFENIEEIPKNFQKIAIILVLINIKKWGEELPMQRLAGGYSRLGPVHQAFQYQMHTIWSRPVFGAPFFKTK